MFDYSKIVDKIVDKQAYFSYVNKRSEIAKHYVVNVSVSDYYLQGICMPARQFKTFKIDNIIQMFDSAEELELSSLPSVSSVLPITNKQKHHGKYEICFTGFSVLDKARLQDLATNAGMIVRHGVTSKLSFLCCGKNAGPSKTSEAREKRILAITEDQFTSLIDTGDIPETGLYDLLTPTPNSLLKDDREDVQDTFSKMRSIPRRSALIAKFVDKYAAGWAFAVHECHRPALDIKLTPIISGDDKFDIWTQGHAFNFIGGELIHSHREASIGQWADFLKIPSAVSLNVKFSTPSGFETIDTLEGSFTGVFRKNSASTERGARHINEMSVLFNSQSYDEGTLTIDVYHPEGDRMKIVERITLTQVEFVTLLQDGSVVRSIKDEKGSRLELYSPFGPRRGIP